MALTDITTTGFNENTAKNLQLDAGALFKNFDKTTMQGELMGATTGGGEFKAIPTMRVPQIDGLKGAGKGLEILESWEVMLTTNFIECSQDVITESLMSTVIDDTTLTDYTSIKPKNYIDEADYTDSIAYVCKLSGFTKPLILIVYNVLNTNGLTLNSQQSNDNIIQLALKAHYDATDLDTPPFEILYPKEV